MGPIRASCCASPTANLPSPDSPTSHGTFATSASEQPRPCATRAPLPSSSYSVSSPLPGIFSFSTVQIISRETRINLPSWNHTPGCFGYRARGPLGGPCFISRPNYFSLRVVRASGTLLRSPSHRVVAFGCLPRRVGRELSPLAEEERFQAANWGNSIFVDLPTGSQHSCGSWRAS